MKRKYIAESTAKDILKEGSTDLYGRIPSFNPKQKYLVVKISRIGKTFIVFPNGANCPKEKLKIEYFYYYNPQENES